MNLPVALIVIPDLLDERRQSVSGLRGELPAKSDLPVCDFDCTRDPSLRIQRERKIVQCNIGWRSCRRASRMQLRRLANAEAPILKGKRGIAKSKQNQLIVRPLRPASVCWLPRKFVGRGACVRGLKRGRKSGRLATKFVPGVEMPTGSD
jgi:hypothetical protein